MIFYQHSPSSNIWIRKTNPNNFWCLKTLFVKAINSHNNILNNKKKKRKKKSILFSPAFEKLFLSILSFFIEIIKGLLKIMATALTQLPSHNCPLTAAFTQLPSQLPSHTTALPLTTALTLLPSHNCPHTTALTLLPSHNCPHTTALTLLPSHNCPLTTALSQLPSHYCPLTTALTLH